MIPTCVNSKSNHVLEEARILPSESLIHGKRIESGVASCNSGEAPLITIETLIWPDCPSPIES